MLSMQFFIKRNYLPHVVVRTKVFGFSITPADAVASGGEPPWFAAAIARMLLPITNDIHTIKNDVQNIKTDIQNIKTDVQGIKDDIQNLKDVQAQVQRIAAIVSISNLQSHTPHNPTDMF